MKRFKSVYLALLLPLFSVFSFVFVNAAGWDISWITTGSVINADKLRAALEYLKNTKADITYVDSKIKNNCVVFQQSSNCWRRISYSCNCSKYGCRTCYRWVYDGKKYRTVQACPNAVNYGSWSSCKK